MQEPKFINSYIDQKYIKSVIPDALCVGAPVQCDGAWKVDSRQVQPGDVFVALKGSRVDGHSFVIESLEKGARTCMIAQSAREGLMPLIQKWLHDRTIIIVHDPQEALITLAASWRAQFTCPVIGVTGSVGKTTTKELIATIFCMSGAQVLSSEGTQNTCIGLSLHMLRIRPEHQYVVFEMGISRRGEMEKLTQLVRPTTAVITALGHSHMEGLGSLSDIAAEKRAIFSCLKEDGIGFVNGDHAQLGMVAYSHPVVKFGCKMINQIQARQIRQNPEGISFVLKLYNERYQINIPNHNMSRVYNALAAAAVTHHFGISSEIIIGGIQSNIVVPGRFQKKYLGATSHLVIDDSYNASPESMKAALVAFEQLESDGKKIAVLGDMLELGVNSAFWHRQVGRFLRKVPSVSHVIFVGERMKSAQRTMPYTVSSEICADWQEAAARVRNLLTQHNLCMLVKASRGIGLNNLISTLSEELSS